MGYRMKLTMGYGLSLSKNPMLDPSKLHFENLEDFYRFERWHLETIEFANNQQSLAEKFALLENNPATNLYDMITYDDEFGDHDLLVLKPASSRDSWTRYGDLLDAYTWEAQCAASGNDLCQTCWMPIPTPLYPYVGLMRPNADEPLGIEKYWGPFHSDEEEQKEKIPWAPWHLWFLLRAVFDLTNEQTTQAFLSLRPGVYRYWS